MGNTAFHQLVRDALAGLKAQLDQVLANQRTLSDQAELINRRLDALGAPADPPANAPKV